MDSRAKELIAIGDALFSKRANLLLLWQDIAENFYPERANFTVTRDIGDDFAGHLMNSYPVIARRELGDLFGAMLRPRSAPWFDLHAQDERIDEEDDARAWLEWASGVQRRAMYDPATALVRATREADHDFATFGQTVIESRASRNLDHLHYRTWNLRDCAWSENESGKIDSLHQNWTPTVRQLCKMFPGKVHESVAKLLEKEPEKEIKCRRIVVPRDEHGYRDQRGPRADFYSLYIDMENSHVMEEGPLNRFPYIVPRWTTVSGSQYGYSPATISIMPDSRLLQSVTRVLLEAGEKAADPPMIATQEVVRSDIALYAGGVTWVDAEYDERLGEALRPMTQDRSGLPFGVELQTELKNAIANGFFLNKIVLPTDGNAKTAYEIRKILEQHIRSSAPLFEPIEEEYNAPLVEASFDILMSLGAFGPVESMPESLRGRDVRFSFTSPLRDSENEIKAQRFLEGANILKVAAEIDPAQIANVNATKVTRDSLRGLGWDADWLNPEEAVDQAREANAQRAADAAAAEQGAAVADIAGKVGPAIEGLQKAGVA